MCAAPLLAWFAERQRRAELAAAKTADESDVGVVDNPGKGRWAAQIALGSQEAQLDYERARYKFEVEKKSIFPTDEITAAVGQMLAGFRTALNMLPSSAARWLIGLRDFHAIKAKLRGGSRRGSGGARSLQIFRGHRAEDSGEVVFRSRRAVSRRVGPSLRASVQEIGRESPFRSSATIASYNIGWPAIAYSCPISENDHGEGRHCRENLRNFIRTQRISS